MLGLITEIRWRQIQSREFLPLSLFLSWSIPFNRCNQTCFISGALSIPKNELLSFAPRNKNKITGGTLSVASFMNNHPRRLFLLQVMKKRNVVFLFQLTSRRVCTYLIGMTLI